LRVSAPVAADQVISAPQTVDGVHAVAAVKRIGALGASELVLTVFTINRDTLHDDILIHSVREYAHITCDISRLGRELSYAIG
jgi:hypothetical protein